MQECPCRNCNQRCQACHNKCYDYANWKIADRDEKEAIAEFKKDHAIGHMTSRRAGNMMCHSRYSMYGGSLL